MATSATPEEMINIFYAFIANGVRTLVSLTEWLFSRRGLHPFDVHGRRKAIHNMNLENLAKTLVSPHVQFALDVVNLCVLVSIILTFCLSAWFSGGREIQRNQHGTIPNQDRVPGGRHSKGTVPVFLVIYDPLGQTHTL